MLSKIKAPVAMMVPMQIQSKFSLLNPLYENHEGSLVLDGTKLFGQGSGKFLATVSAHGLLLARCALVPYQFLVCVSKPCAHHR
jgi:hypothetical protein